MSIKYKALWINIPLFLFALVLFSCEQQPAHAETFVHSMSREITPGYFEGVVRNLVRAKEGDQLILHINSPGGDLRETMRFVDAMVSSKAYIICKADHASSAAAVIFMVCDE